MGVCWSRQDSLKKELRDRPAEGQPTVILSSYEKNQIRQNLANKNKEASSPQNNPQSYKHSLVKASAKQPSQQYHQQQALENSNISMRQTTNIIQENVTFYEVISSEHSFGSQTRMMTKLIQDDEMQLKKLKNRLEDQKHHRQTQCDRLSQLNIKPKSELTPHYKYMNKTKIKKDIQQTKVRQLQIEKLIDQIYSDLQQKQQILKQANQLQRQHLSKAQLRTHEKYRNLKPIFNRYRNQLNFIMFPKLS